MNFARLAKYEIDEFLKMYNLSTINIYNNEKYYIAHSLYFSLLKIYP